MKKKRKEGRKEGKGRKRKEGRHDAHIAVLSATYLIQISANCATATSII